MIKLKILLWVSLILVLVACKHEVNEQPKKDISVNYSQLFCYETDTIYIDVLLDNKPFTGNVNWNDVNITKDGNRYLFIAPSIYTDTSFFLLTGNANQETISQKINVIKRAFKQPLVSYRTTIQPLLTNNCNFSGCHANGSRAGKVELSMYDSTMNSVVPYNASASLLYVALIKTDPLRIMPPAGKLHDYKIEEVRLWIEQGAKEN